MTRPDAADTSLIVTTYNWPRALSAVLETVRRQNVLPGEVLVADDGSGPETRQMLERTRDGFPCPLEHIWHPDEGYQVARIRNRAATAARGGYLIFIDGDCLLRPDFIERHIQLGREGHFVAGNRVLLTPEFTGEVLDSALDITRRSPLSISRSDVNRRWSLMRLPMGWLRRAMPRRWKGVMTCNLGLFTSDFLATNGFEEHFEGWGYEDSDLAVRLHHLGIRRISGRFAVTVLHLWHQTNRSSLEESNWARLQETIHSDRIRAVQGIEQSQVQR